MHRGFKFLWIRNDLLLFYKPSLRFIFIAFIQPQSFRGVFYFSWHGMTFYSASCIGGNFCRLFAQMYAAFHMVYGFCIHLCTAFAHIVRLLCMYTAYILRKLCGFCVRIRIFCSLSGFAYVYGLSLAMFNADSI